MQSERLDGVEALVRWQHPRLGWVAPDRFIPLAEHSGLIRGLTGRVLREAIATAAFEKLAATGIRIAIDDFGTGMSSLSYLRRLPVDDIKIDRSFVTDMLSDEHNAVLVHSIIDLSHNLGRRVIAEGIEDGPTLERLKALGCDMAQGYFIGRPEPRARLEALLGGAAPETGAPVATPSLAAAPA